MFKIVCYSCLYFTDSLKMNRNSYCVHSRFIRLLYHCNNNNECVRKTDAAIFAQQVQVRHDNHRSFFSDLSCCTDSAANRFGGNGGTEQS